MKHLLVLALFLFPQPAVSDLSTSEQAAVSQRGISEQERHLRRIGCSFKATDSGETITISNEIVVQIVSLPEFTVLTYAEITLAKTSGKYDITTFADLPNGGIGGKDFCATVTLDGYPHPKAHGDPILAMGLLLRSNMDMLNLYPTTGAEIMRRQQVKTLPAGKYVPIDLSQKEKDAWYKSFGGAWPKRSTNRLGIRLQNIHYFPVE